MSLKQDAQQLLNECEKHLLMSQRSIEEGSPALQKANQVPTNLMTCCVCIALTVSVRSSEVSSERVSPCVYRVSCESS